MIENNDINRRDLLKIFGAIATSPIILTKTKDITDIPDSPALQEMRKFCDEQIDPDSLCAFQFKSPECGYKKKYPTYCFKSFKDCKMPERFGGYIYGVKYG